jgi:hypothetical protein
MADTLNHNGLVRDVRLDLLRRQMRGRVDLVCHAARAVSSARLAEELAGLEGVASFSVVPVRN